PWLDAMMPDAGWAGCVSLAAGILAGLAIAVALAVLIAPVSALIAGLFLDDAADLIERADYAGDPVGRGMPIGRSVVLSMKFFGIVILGNLFALVLLIVPGVNLIAFFVVNGYLLGREYFEFAAMRFRSEAEAKALRRRNAGTVFGAGLLIAAVLSVPIVNLLAPLFAAAMMVHLHKLVSARENRSATAARAS